MHEDKKLVLPRRLGTPRNHFIAHIVNYDHFRIIYLKVQSVWQFT